LPVGEKSIIKESYKTSNRFCIDSFANQNIAARDKTIQDIKNKEINPLYYRSLI